MLFYLPFPEAIQLQQTDTYALLTRAPLIQKASSLYSVRLACVKPAASVRSEPGSNSHVNTYISTSVRPDISLFQNYTVL